MRPGGVTARGDRQRISVGGGLEPDRPAHRQSKGLALPERAIRSGASGTTDGRSCELRRRRDLHFASRLGATRVIVAKRRCLEKAIGTGGRLAEPLRAHTQVCCGLKKKSGDVVFHVIAAEVLL